MPEPVDAVVSATALHWLGRDQLASLYEDVPRVLRTGGIFLNADHVGSSHSQVQREWERHRETMRRQEGFIEACIANARRATNGSPDPLAFAPELADISCAGVNSRADDWDGFFEAFGKALGIDVDAVRRKAIGEYRGNEEGMSLAWHFARLRANRFRYVDCFWRCDCDAIYGGILGL
jgi:hypothetical protein